jgi:hypothetical protein
MRSGELQEGKSYQNKEGVKRTIRKIGKTEDSHRLHVFFGEDGKIKNLPIREFADWAVSRVN